MIFTVTFNPSLDYVVEVEDFTLGRTNRTVSEEIVPGGKGINVSTMLTHLGIENTALGFTAGFTGEEISRGLERIGVKAEFIHLSKGNSRINLKLKSVEGTEINGQGPEIKEARITELMNRLEVLKEGDILVLGGSIPATMPDSIYRDIMKRLAGRGVHIVVDATKELLLNVLEYQPFLIKPNKDELEEIFSVKLQSREEILHYADKLREMGAENVLVSLGGEGAILIAADGKVYDTPVPKGELVNGVGAGDSMVAGFLRGWLLDGEYRTAFYMGVAAGSASAFSKHLAKKEDVETLYRELVEGAE
ncbi:1-phosphofructokinase [Lachnospiraceae bacterium PF1-21]|uniref:1-phosphofructokinase n=1 Tax=Ohessyouella blattaphilus TaxID=2949333 RepID=UPI003E1C276B